MPISKQPKSVVWDDDFDAETPDYHTYDGESSTCPSCFGEMEWCSGCQMYSQTCCDEYGTCMCS